MKRIACILALAATHSLLPAGVLPGFKLQKLASAQGFVTSVVVDSRDRIYYSVTAGGIFRIDAGQSVLVASVDTASEGNAALLGIALRDDNTMIAHHVSPDLTADLISTIDLATGERTGSIRLTCFGGQPCSTEHHGGNPVVGPDGAIYVGIGDFGAPQLAQQAESWGGKIVRIVNQTPEVFASGFRNPFDLVVDPVSGLLYVADNGVVGGDEINVISRGDNAGWPLTMGTQGPVDGTVAPIYTFPHTTAPTGMLLLSGPAPGLLVGSFVSKTLYYFANLSERPLAEPVEILKGDIGPVLDMSRTSSGEVIVAAAAAIFRLVFPMPGDADGNGRVDSADLRAISHEILDGDGDLAVHAQNGRYRGSWGADANQDGLIDSRDLVTLAKKRTQRSRAVRP